MSKSARPGKSRTDPESDTGEPAAEIVSAASILQLMKHWENRNREEAQEREDRHRKEMQEQTKIWEALLSRGSTHSADETTEPSMSLGRSRQQEKVEKFRRIAKDEDVETYMYLASFEAHMSTYRVEKEQWTKYLAPLLDPQPNRVYIHLEEDQRRDYDAVKRALYSHYRVTQTTQRTKLDQLRRQPGETWVNLGHRGKSITKKWMSDCLTVDDAADLVTSDVILKRMPRQLAVHVRDQKPKTMLDALDIADEFMAVRGWDYDTVTETERVPTKQPRRDEKGRPTADRVSQERPRVSKDREDSKEPASLKPAHEKEQPGSWKSQPKFDRSGKPRCFKCNIFGHFASECHTKAAPVKPKTEAVNFVNPLTQYEELDLLEARINRIATVEGSIGDVQCKNILLDTGASQTVVKGELVRPEQYTGGHRLARAFNGTQEKCPIAKVTVEVDGVARQLEVIVVDDLEHDALLGMDIPELWAIGKRLLYDSLINMVKTRSTTTEPLTQLPGNFREPRSEPNRDAMDSDDNSDEDCPFLRNGSEKMNLYDEDIDSSNEETGDRDSEVSDEVESTPAEDMEDTGGEAGSNQLADLDDPTSAKTSRSTRRKARADFVRGRPGHPLDVEAEELREAQRHDETLDKWWEKAEAGDSRFTVEDGLLFKIARDRLGDECLLLCVPRSFRSLVLSLAHRPGHLGRDRTVQRIAEDYCWPGLHAEVKQLCRACSECQKAAKLSQPPAPLRPLPIISIPFQRIAMDMIGPLPTTAQGNRFALVIMDFATRWPEALPLRVTDSRTVADELLILFTRVGTPEEILTDCGKNFVGKLMGELYSLLGVRGITTTPYHPATDGMVERFNSTLKHMIRKTSKRWNGQWDLALPFLLGEYRRSPNASTGFTPSELLYGRQINGPLQLLRKKWTGSKSTPKSVIEYLTSVQDRLEEIKDLASDREERKKNEYKEHFDQKARERSFRAGELVLLRTPILGPKMSTEWEGPYTVLEKVDATTYLLDVPNHPRKKIKRHINLLKQFVSPTAGCMLVTLQPDGDDFGPSDPGGERSMPRINDSLTDSEKEMVQQLLFKHDKLVHGATGLTNRTEIRIETGSAYPISRPPYRLNITKARLMDDAVRELLELQIIRPSLSPWASPALLVAKKDGTQRLCIDYRALNNVTVPDPFPLPLIGELLDKLGKAKFISTLDLEKGYHQVPVQKDSIPKTAFITSRGKWEYVRMPFGLKNAPSTFQRLMNAVMADLADFASAYIDDIVVYSDNFSDHLKHLETVFVRLLETGLKVKAAKCTLAERSCQYLGHKVGDGLIRPLQAKIRVMTEYPRPNKKKDMRAFLGLANYYRRFVPDFGSIAIPLTETTRKSAPDKIVWTEQCVEAFQRLKEALTKDPVLASPDPDRRFILHTDASGVGIGAVLSQEDRGGTDRPVAYYSRKLKQAETRYAVTEQECLAVVMAVKHFSVYLSGAEFTVVTDHRSLIYLQQRKDDSGRLTRWSLALQPYLFTIVHRPGTKHQNADGLSRQS